MKIITSLAAVTLATAVVVPATQPSRAEAITCNAGGYPAGTGCIGLPPEFGITDAQASQNRAWARCVAAAATFAIPEGKAVGAAAAAIKAGKATVALGGWHCDLNAVVHP